MDAINRPLRIKRLEESLEKWQNILRSRDARLDEGTEVCPCCAQWFLQNVKDGEQCFKLCNGCPIRDFTGLPGCAGTPYIEFISAAADADESMGPFWNDDVERAVNAEITFLVNLITFEEYAHEYELNL
jgi:hypothetical protein